MDNKSIEKLKKKVNNRVVGVLSHGKSIYELQERANDFRELDICWASFNYYDLLHSKILIRMCKGLDIALECASSRDKKFEMTRRLPRIMAYICMKTSIITTWRLMRTEYEKMEISMIYEELLKHHLILADDILGELNVPNSLSLLIYCLIATQPKKIILFGVDGYKKEDGDEFDTYFEGEKQKEYRQELLGGKLEYTLHETSEDFENDFLKMYDQYAKKLGVSPPVIINCSPNSHFKKIRNVSYDEVLEELKTGD